MRVKVHPHRGKYLRLIEECVSITPDEKGGRVFYSGAITLKDMRFRVHPSGVKRAQFENQRNVHAWAVGEAGSIYRTRFPLPFDGNWQPVTYHFDSGEFRMLHTGENVTDVRFPYAHVSGRDFYVLDNRSTT